MRPAIVGSGAIGGTVAAHLVAAGHSMRFGDTDRTHVAAMRRDGRRSEGPIATLRVAVHATGPEEGRERTLGCFVSLGAIVEAARNAGLAAAEVGA